MDEIMFMIGPQRSTGSRGGSPRRSPREDADALCEVLEALSAVPATVELLKETHLGVLTQPLKDHANKQVRSVAKRLRRGWKDIVSEAKERSAEGPAEDVEAEHGGAAALKREAWHAMRPPPPGAGGDRRKTNVASIAARISQ
ncbi:unnamed protein product [Prorocentrum cordatum]|uniref:TFIIS N-terminal domain-containing protein n=1 Tax=Prorocentrum cordatum TaxID=2364126 RepID=A0ABN9XNT7_9DINO|nr:unnamed protein product [Polarella glacialis]